MRTLEIREMIILIIFGSFSVRSVCCYIHYALRNIRLFPPPFLIKVDFQCGVSFSVLHAQSASAISTAALKSLCLTFLCILPIADGRRIV